MSLNSNIYVDQKRKFHSKASEEYVHVIFTYPMSQKDNLIWDGWVPVKYRRTGISIEENENEKLDEYLNIIYDQINPANLQQWIQTEEQFWRDEKANATTTKAFFDILAQGGWKCVGCALPSNPNWARRVQDLKEFGYTLATDTNRFCPICKKTKTHLILLPIPRGYSAGNGYETLSPKLRKKILSILNKTDVYENIVNPHCLPDHKFPEIRWDEKTKAENPESMSDDEIKNKFQLLSNQRNLQKREVCRTCSQTGKRGIIYGIPFYYEGGENWDESIPKRGKEAEQGCVGCPWYDIARWRKELLMKLGK